MPQSTSKLNCSVVPRWCAISDRLVTQATVRLATRREATNEVMDWLNFYNHKSLHSKLGYVNPMTFEQR